MSVPGTTCIGVFLDVGTGVGWLAIEAARCWPTLRVIGIDPWEPALTLARKNLAKSGVAERIELRSQNVENLNDEKILTVAWLPGLFISAEIMTVAWSPFIKRSQDAHTRQTGATEPKVSILQRRIELCGDAPLSAAAALQAAGGGAYGLPWGRYLPAQAQSVKSQGVRGTESPEPFDETANKPENYVSVLSGEVHCKYDRTDRSGYSAYAKGN